MALAPPAGPALSAPLFTLGRAGARRPAVPPARLYWKRSLFAGLAILAVLVVRLTELFPALGLIRPVLLVSVVVLVGHLRRTQHRIIVGAFRETQLRLLLAYAVWAMVGVPFALYRSAALQGLMVFPYAILLTLSLLLIEPTVRNLNRLLTGFVLCVVFFGAMMLMERDFGARLSTGGMYDPNDLAALMGMTIPIALGLFLRAGGQLRQRAVIAVGLVVLITVLAKTGSRGGMLGILAGLLVFLAAQRLGRKVWLGGLLVVVGIGLVVAGPPTFRQRARSLINLENDYNYTSEVGRKEIWKRGIRHTLDHPIFGVGVENFAEAEGQTFTQRGEIRKWFTAHNTYIQAFAEMGFPGGILVLSMVGLAGARGFRYWRRSSRPPRALWYPDLLACLAVFCTSGFFLSHAYSYLFFGVLALLAFAERVRIAVPSEPRPA